MNCAKNAPAAPQPLSNLSLESRNTFGLPAIAELAYDITSPDQLPGLMADILNQGGAWRVLGGGSNVVLPNTLSGTTLLMSIFGKEIIDSNDHFTAVAVGAGENWHDFVAWTLEHNLPGLENLALIPGTVGAAPIQNIGAYGAEVADYLACVEVFDYKEQAFVTLNKADCHFAYRDSYFKQNPGRFIVTKVVFKIPQAWMPRLTYADLAKQFSDHSSPSAQEIFTAVCNIRQSKLPDPKVIGNAGSFFQNPIVDTALYQNLLALHPNLASYPDANGTRKLAAGWLIDQCGFKGYQSGPAGVYEKQALVLVNHGGATANDILELANVIQKKVKERFGIELQIEPNIL
jgi:UDP-N-acetylmuramate dehydrogenase